MALILGCHASPRPSSKSELNCDNLEDASGTTTFGDYVEVACACGAGRACEFMAMLLEKEGGSEKLASAAEYRAKACKLGWTASCSAQHRDPP
ncbi:MAG TPA: hypothetical protein VFE90_13920 [Myxococcales bacterium]|nr:hypothetical protein [Myxococcales bacterium]